MFVGTLECDVLLGDVRSLKAKRGLVRPVLAELRRLDVAAAEVGHQDLHRRSLIGIGIVAGDSARCCEVLDTAERLVAGHPELELLSTRRRLLETDDE